MTVQELLDRVSGVIQDSSYSTSTLLTLLNRGLLDVASKVLLPLLAASGTVTTTANPSVALPTNYHRKLTFVSSARVAGKITIETSWQRFINRFPLLDQAGSVYLVSVRGASLYYQGIPASADTLTLHYHRKPTAMTSSALTASPDGLDSPFDELLLVNFALKEIYTDIEDGIDGAAVNTKKHEGRYLRALLDLREFLGPEDSDPVYVRDDDDSEGWW